MANGHRTERAAPRGKRQREGFEAALAKPEEKAKRQERSSGKGKRLEATQEARAKWTATNGARERLSALAGTDEEGRLDITGLDWSQHFAAAGSTPRRVVQFWDRDPPEQVAILLARVGEVCAATGYEHMLYDLATARARIEEIAGPEWVEHYDRAFHPSMQADIFRLLELHHGGGLYIDADMALSRPIPFTPPPVPLFVQWGEGPRTNVANWFLCTPPGQAIYARIIGRMKRKLGEAPRDTDGRYIKQNLLGLTGPLVVARALERYLSRNPEAKDIAVMPASWCHSFVQPARRFFQAKVDYKASGQHWKRPGGAS